MNLKKEIALDGTVKTKLGEMNRFNRVGSVETESLQANCNTFINNIFGRTQTLS